jgi:two-component system, chemotaxis family, protein-glutamate methylesterase/glutaminase
MSNKGNISVLIVEDSALMRIILSDLLKADPEIRVAGTANNGKDGAEKTVMLQPDVVISDVIMPEYDGTYLVREVMKKRPTPIILLSALDKSNHLVFDALKEGAFDFLDKPKEDISNSIKAKNYPLIDLVKVAAQGKLEALKKAAKENHHEHTFDNERYALIVVGSSTGGPAAVESFINQLPANLQLPVIITQHMPEGFIQSFSQRLNKLAPFEVKLAEKGEDLRAGKVYLVPGYANFKLKHNPVSGSVFFSTTEKQYKEFNNPSIDCMMESAAKVFKGRVIGVILTGMGKDGSQGLQAIKDAGGMTIAQDEASAVVYGMPKSAWESGAASHQVGIDQLGGFIMSCF